MRSVLLLATCLIIFGCNKGTGNPATFTPAAIAVAAEDQGVISAKKMDQLLDEDFSDIIAQCTVSQEEQDKRASLMADPQDKLLLDTLVSPHGKKRALAVAVADVANFAHEHGRLPVNGLELFPDLLTVKGYSAYMNLSRTERFERYSSGINLATGKFYATYTGKWNPGGLSFERDEQGRTIVLKRQKNGKPLLSTKSPSGVDELWHYKAYGLTQNKIIYEDWVGLKKEGHDMEQTNVPMQHEDEAMSHGH
jgi:hypothetical protein